ncbi:DUF2027 domain-containing protein [Porphyromonas cangingivalis]|uniref:Smr/MutS family protein n=1 Tax=Porphyromonas cangingivalis TaxID=36874 RepID=UPI00051DBB63|nr:DUF2027 domain-containing protein [Porphyromonas cangingivalis]KGL47728.1 hypothetical protein HQ34_09250 [Porphyromonas cangingivalis]
MSHKDIKVGDNVRFLNATGSGVVKAIRSGGIIEVEDETGFDIPVLASEIVVVTPGSGIVPKPEIPRRNTPQPTSASAPMAVAPEPEKQRPATPKVDRPTDPAHEVINAVLAYLPSNPEAVGDCDYEAYIVNDSNYDLHAHYMISDGGDWRVMFSGVVPFDSSTFIEAFPPSGLAARNRVKVQLLAFKSDAPFVAKPAYEANFRITGMRFFKTNAFVPNDYFDDGAIIFPLIEDDKPVQSKKIDAQRLEQEMMMPKTKGDTTPMKPKAKEPKQPRVIVEDLHIHELVDSTAGLDNKAMLDIQLEHVRKVMHRHRNEKKRRIVFIHGKGEGVLRKAVMDLIKKEYPKALMQDASFQEYGFGATEVIIY